MNKIHPMKVWVEANTTQSALARRLGCSGAHVSDVLNFKKEPSLELAARMSRESGGVVPIDAFVWPREAAE